MESQFNIEVAGETVNLRLKDNCLFEILNKDYQAFLSLKPAQTFLDLKTTNRMRHLGAEETGLFFGEDAWKIREEHLDSSFDFKAKKGWARINPSGLPWALSNFLRNIFTLLLVIQDNALIFHASAIVREGKAYIFIGPSGSGKTTISKLSRDYSVLSDDHVLIKKIDGSFLTFPTPCWQDFSRGKKENKPYPIGGLFKLVKDQRVYLKKINKSQAVMELFTVPRIPPRFLAFDNFLATFEDLLENFPLYALHFSKDTRFWRRIDALQK